MINTPCIIFAYFVGRRLQAIPMPPVTSATVARPVRNTPTNAAPVQALATMLFCFVLLDTVCSDKACCRFSRSMLHAARVDSSFTRIASLLISTSYADSSFQWERKH